MKKPPGATVRKISANELNGLKNNVSKQRLARGEKHAKSLVSAMLCATVFADFQSLTDRPS